MSDPHCSILGNAGDLQVKLVSFTTQLCMHLAQNLERLKKQELLPQANKVTGQISDNTWKPRQHLACLQTITEGLGFLASLPDLPKSAACREGSPGKHSPSSPKLTGDKVFT